MGSAWAPSWLLRGDGTTVGGIGRRDPRRSDCCCTSVVNAPHRRTEPRRGSTRECRRERCRARFHKVRDGSVTEEEHRRTNTHQHRNDPAVRVVECMHDQFRSNRRNRGAATEHQNETYHELGELERERQLGSNDQRGSPDGPQSAASATWSILPCGWSEPTFNRYTDLSGGSLWSVSTHRSVVARCRCLFVLRLAVD